jgi:anti-anti-sigma factor
VNEWDVAFERVEHDGVPVLVVRGEIDVAVVTQFAQELDALVGTSIERQDAKMVVDLAGVGFIDSSGVRELLNAQRRAQSSGGEILLRSPSAPCLRVLEVSGASLQFIVTDATD